MFSEYCNPQRFSESYSGNPGVKGCQNILPGGDTSGDNFQDDGPFLTYVVWRSFKFPPPIPPLRK